MKAGLKADIVALSLAPDVDELVKAGLVDAKWNRQSYKGMVHDSVVVFAVRDGNPKKIKTWDDLLKPGVSVITPNPFTSGGARWNVMAAYGSWIKLKKTRKQAQAKLLRLFQNVTVQDKSARDSLNTFLSGKGDVLLTYENEAIAAQRAGQKIQYVIPRQTILIENPIAVLKESENIDKARQFLRFLKTPAAQQIFADYGYRPIVPSVLQGNQAKGKFPVRPGQFTHRREVARRLDEGAEAVLRSGHGHHGRDRATDRRRHWLASPQPSRARGARTRGTGPARPCPSAS